MVEYKKHPILNVLCTKEGKILGRNINATDSKGYLMVSINGIGYSVHRIIYETFYNCILSKEQQIDHIDRDKLNNSIDNLRVVSNMENQYNTSRNRKFIANYNNKTYICNAISYFSRKFNIPDSNISKALNNEIKHVNGWIFIDIDNNNTYKFLKDKYFNNLKKDEIIILKDISEEINIENKYQGRFDKIILATNLETQEKYIFSNLAHFCKNFGITTSNAGKVLKGERKTCKGFTFQTTNEFNNLKIKKDEIIKL